MNEYLSSMTLAVANHLWQSTLVIAAAWLLTLMLRTNTARTRQRIWIAASLKFLLPFSLLVTAGSHMVHPKQVVQSSPALDAESAFYTGMDQWAQPAPALATAARLGSTALNASGKRQSTVWHAAPMLLTAVWLCGFAAIVSIWSVRWRRLTRVQRAAIPMPAGRETAALLRVQQRNGTRSAIRMMRIGRQTGRRMEPGVMGVRRQILLWPDGISDRLSDAQMETILAHEMQHVRHKDNLAALLHMAVEAIFWFYPLVWWMETRLVEERERACDEEVLRMGNKPGVYAQSILKTCEFCLESPMACVAGVTGGELKTRIVQIMSRRTGRELSLTRKVLLASAAVLVVAGQLVFGLVYAPQVRAQGVRPLVTFRAATIKRFIHDPHRSAAAGVYSNPGGRVQFVGNIKLLVEQAFDLQEYQVTGGPGWFSSRSSRFEIDAVPPEGSASRNLKLRTPYPTSEQQLMLLSLLRDRFGLKYHFETKEGEVYILSRGSGTPQLKPTTHAAVDPRAIVFGRLGEMEQMPNAAVDYGKPSRGVPYSVPDGTPMGIWGYNTTTDYLALRMSRFLLHPVLNRTGLGGSFDFDLPFDRGNHDMGLTVLKLADDLGLKIERGRGPVRTLVIDHVDPPDVEQTGS